MISDGAPDRKFYFEEKKVSKKEEKGGGQDRIRTCEGDASGFTVRPV